MKKEKTVLTKVKSYLTLMRIKHYIKNFLIFLPLIFSMEFTNIENSIRVLIGFFLFSITCSIVYILNDIQDVEKDREHPQKRNRPIAAGKIQINEAYFLVLLLLIVTIIGVIIGNINGTSIVILASYFILNIIYTKKLKNIPLVDVALLVTFFVLRVIYGASLINVAVSNWLYLTIISFSFYLSLGKRRNELERSQEDKKNIREVLKLYNKDFLDKNMYLCLALTIVFYSLWCVDPMNIQKFGSSYLVLTVPLVMIICMKYSLNIEGSSYGDPVEVVLSDKILIALIILYCILMGFIIFC